MYNVTLRRVRATIVAVVFVALGNQHAVRMRTYYIVICGLPGSTILLQLSHKRQDFRKKKKLFNFG